MHGIQRTIAVIAILALLATGTAVAARACLPAAVIQAGAPGPAAAGDSAASENTCTREAMGQCEYTCMMPGGILDLYCYEDCIRSIC